MKVGIELLLLLLLLLLFMIACEQKKKLKKCSEVKNGDPLVLWQNLMNT